MKNKKLLLTIVIVILMTGNLQPSYGKEQLPTRLDGVKLLVEAIGPRKSVFQYDFTHPFKDIDKKDNFYIGYLYQKGIIKGCNDHIFNPNQSMDGNTFCILLLRILGYNEEDGDSTWKMGINLALTKQIINEEDALKIKNNNMNINLLKKIINQCLDLPIKGSNQTLRQLKEKNQKESFNKMASINANISDKKRFDEQDDYIYYPNIYDENKLYKYDVKEKKNYKVLDETCEYIQVVDDNVYFLKPQNFYKKPDGGIMKYNMTNKKLTKLKSPNNLNINNFVVFKDKIYFELDRDIYDQIYSMDLNGNKTKFLVQGSSLRIDENNLYTTFPKVNKCDLNGRNKICINKESLWQTLLISDEFYSIESSPNSDDYNKISNSIYKVNKYNGNMEEIFNVKDIVAYNGENIRIKTLEYYNGKIVMHVLRYSEFISDYLRMTELLTYDLETGEVETIASDISEDYINVFKNKIFFMSGKYNPSLYSININKNKLKINEAEIDNEKTYKIINDDNEYIYFIKYKDRTMIYKLDKSTKQVSIYKRNIKKEHSNPDDELCTPDEFYLYIYSRLYKENIELAAKIEEGFTELAFDDQNKDAIKERVIDSENVYWRVYKRITDEELLEYKVTKDYIYYTKGSFDIYADLSGPLYRIDKKTMKKELITEDKVHAFYIYNNYIYYNREVNSDFEEALYRMNLDGTDRITIFNGKYTPWHVNFYNDKLYVKGTWRVLGDIYYETVYSLLEIDLKTMKVRDIGQYDFLWDIYAYKGKVYFQDNNNVYQYDIDKEETKIILNQAAFRELYFFDDSMYFYSTELKYCNMDTKEIINMKTPEN